jgi:hypothetical protein
MPANRLPSVCCAARPTTTAVNAPPSASVRGPRPAIRSAISTAASIVTSRSRKPTVPAVPGSMRRNSVGPIARPTSRANCQPSAISTRNVTIRTGVS